MRCAGHRRRRDVAAGCEADVGGSDRSAGMRCRLHTGMSICRLWISLTFASTTHTICRSSPRFSDMKCENCNNPATVHLMEVKAGKKIEKHLCENCAAQLEGIGGQPAKGHTPINELLTNFVM